MLCATLSCRPKIYSTDTYSNYILSSASIGRIPGRGDILTLVLEKACVEFTVISEIQRESEAPIAPHGEWDVPQVPHVLSRFLETH